MNTTDPTLQAPENESGIEALKRYDQIVSIKSLEFQNEKKVQHKESDSADSIDSVESLFGFTLPLEYKEFLMQHGAFVFGSDRGVFSLYSGAELYDILKLKSTEKFACRLGIVDYINYVWDGREDLNEALSAQDTQQLNAAYHVIGFIHVDDNAHRYLFINRSGKCGVLHYDQDYLDELLDDNLIPMLQGKFTALNFDKLLASEIQRCLMLLK